jgi:transcriptional regulator with XRE-family HTH domain
MELRHKLRARRQALRMTQRALAVKVALTNATICSFEAGQRNLSTDALERICAALGLRLTVEVIQEEVMRESA